MNTILKITAGSLLALSMGTAFAFSEEGGDGPPSCEFSEGGCGGPSTPQAPALPAAYSYSANFFTYPDGHVVDGGINSGTGQFFTFGGGAGTPYNGQLITVGNASSGISLQTSLTPVASVTANATQTGLGRTSVDNSLGYSVVLHASDAASADHISQLIASGSTIATISGSYTLATTGTGYSSVSVSSGNGVDSAINPIAASSRTIACGQSYGMSSPATGCGTGSFRLAVSFVSASAYDGGDALDFISVINLGAHGETGLPYADFLAHPGTAGAFIDPTITLASGVNGSLTVGGGSVSNITPSVPEPQSWAMLLGGLAVLAIARRSMRA